MHDSPQASRAQGRMTIAAIVTLNEDVERRQLHCRPLLVKAVSA